jgi:hypothetical protein
VSFDDSVFLRLAILSDLIKLFFSLGFLLFLNFRLFLKFSLSLSYQLFKFRLLPLFKQIKHLLKSFHGNKGLRTSIVRLGIVGIVLETNLAVDDDLTVVLVF